VTFLFAVLPFSQIRRPDAVARRAPVELTRPGPLEPDAAATAAVVSARHAAGLMVLTCGTFGKVLRSCRLW